MDKEQQNPEEIRPEDDWGLSLEEQRGLAEKRRPQAVKEHGAGMIALDNTDAVIPGPQAASLDQPTAPTPTMLPHRSKPDQYPAFMARSALFSASKHGAALPPATALKAQGNYGLRVGGPRLGMRDKAVWEAAMQVAKETNDISQDIPVGLADLARRLGLEEANGATCAWLRDSLARLAQTDVEVELQSQTRAGKLLASARVGGRACAIRLDLTLSLSILEEDFQFNINSSRRRSLNGSLAQWLHDFISTHSAYGGRITLAYLRELCGFEGQSKRFPSLLNAALVELAKKAPELVVGHSFKKVGRSSDKWEVDIQRGQEMPSFSKPKSKGGLVGAPASSDSRKIQKWLAL